MHGWFSFPSYLIASLFIAQYFHATEFLKLTYASYHWVDFQRTFGE
jgi:hypothetical protein